MVGQEGDAQPVRGRVAEDGVIGAGHARLVAQHMHGPVVALEGPGDFARLVVGAERREGREIRDVGAELARGLGAGDEYPARVAEHAQGEGGIARQRAANAQGEVDPLLDEIDRPIRHDELELDLG